MEFSLLDKINLSLLVIAIVFTIIVGSLYAVVHNKTGPAGVKGDTGAQGAAQVPITGSILQINATNFSGTTTFAKQYTSTVTVNASGNAQSLAIGSVYMFGVLSSMLSKPPTPAFGVAFFDSIHTVPVTIDTGGTITIGPMPALASTFVFTLVFQT